MVKLVTHVIFSTAIILFMAKLFEFFGLSLATGIELFFIAGTIAIITNYIIDAVGHERRGPYVRRTKNTHSLSGATLVSLITAIILYILFWFVLGITSIQFGFWLFVLCLASSYAHLLADLPTEGGVYYHNHRVKLGGFKYNGPVNLLFLLLSFVIFYIANPFVI